MLEGYSCVNLMTSFISSINNLCLKIGEIDLLCQILLADFTEICVKKS